LGVEIDYPFGGSREIAKNIGGVTDGYDFVVSDEDPAVAKHPAFGIHGHDHGVVENDRCVNVGHHV
jgi:hypothetical protein